MRDFFTLLFLLTSSYGAYSVVKDLILYFISKKEAERKIKSEENRKEIFGDLTMKKIHDSWNNFAKTAKEFEIACKVSRLEKENQELKQQLSERKITKEDIFKPCEFNKIVIETLQEELNKANEKLEKYNITVKQWLKRSANELYLKAHNTCMSGSYKPSWMQEMFDLSETIRKKDKEIERLKRLNKKLIKLNKKNRK